MRVRQRLEVASAPTSRSSRRCPHLVAARGRGLLQAARARVPQARHQLQARQAVRAGRAHRRPACGSSLAKAARPSRPRCCSSPSAAARSRPTSATRSRASRWTAASSPTDERLPHQRAGRLRGRRHRARPAARPPRLPAGHLRRRGDRRAQPGARSTRPASRGSPTATPRSPRWASPRSRGGDSTAPTRSRRYNYNLGGNGKSQILKTAGFVKLDRARRTARSSASTWSAPGSANSSARPS